MREGSGALGLGASALVIVGTLGLLAAEFVFDWGRTVTLIFAASNVIGLVGLGFVFFSRDKGQGS